ncbi:MAG: two-component hybrid sensor and regulator, partial [Verrucomicrobia bacterium]
MRRRLVGWGAILALAAVYFCAGKFGLSLASLNASASAVWPPSGIALAAVLLGGYRLWPGILLGAFLVNITTQGSVITTGGVAVGNTLEAVSAAWLVHRFAGGLKAFERARNIFKFVLLAAMLSPMLSATFGVTSLCLGHFARWHQYSAIWLTWWLGDMVSDLTIAPLLLVCLARPFIQSTPKRIPEEAGLLLTVALVGSLVFFNPFAAQNYPLEYLAILPLLWAA